MVEGKSAAAVIVAAGASRRMGFDKLRVPLSDGETALEKSVRAFDSHPLIDALVLVTGADDAAARALAGACRKPVRIVRGGRTRAGSVAAGLDAVDQALVAIHDAARPFVSEEIITAALTAAREMGAAAPAVPVKDTVKVAENGLVLHTPPRETLFAVQTPQCFSTALYRQALAACAGKDEGITDDCSLLERAGFPVRLVAGSYENYKITTPEDLPAQEMGACAFPRPAGGETHESSVPRPEKGPCDLPLSAGEDIYGDMPAVKALPANAVRIGHGYDVHRLVEGRALILGGVKIPYEKGLLGHSDADVLTHAVMDALLGAAALGDIGKLFPDSDPAYAGADSVGLLREVTTRLRAHGYAPANIDATVLCQAPKLAPHIPAMRAALAEAMSMPAGDVSIKATTEEKLGFTGDGSGIAAHCVCLVKTFP